MPTQHSRPTDLADLLDNVVYPKLSVDQVYTHSAHQWGRQNSGACTGGCPWHETGGEASFVVAAESLKWWCRRCKIGGTPIQYLWKLRGGTEPTPPSRNFVELARELCNLAEIEFPEADLSDEDRQSAQQRDARRSILQTVIAHSQEVLWSPRGKRARTYLSQQKGFADEQIRELGLGYYSLALEFRRTLKDHGHPLKVVDDASVLWSKWEGYVLFPWLDEHGHPLTIYGRWHTAEPPDERPRTLVLPGEETTRSPLYFDRARQEGCEDVVMVDEVLPAALLQAYGDHRVVACGAEQVSRLQVETLARHQVRSVTLCLATDAAEGESTTTCLRALTDAGIRSYVAPRLDNDLPPDTFLLLHGLDAWRERIGQARRGVLWRAERLMDSHDLDTDTGKDAALESLLEYGAQLRDARDREDLWELTAERTGYARKTLAELAEDQAGRRRRQQTEVDLRRVLREASEALENHESVSDVLQTLTAELASLQSRTIASPRPFSVSRLAKETGRLPARRSSGWQTLDRLPVWFAPGDLTVVAGGAGHGKTTFLVNLLLNWLRQGSGAATDETLVLYLDKEPELRVFHRLLALLTTDHADESNWWPANDVRDFLRDSSSREHWPSAETLDAARAELHTLESRLLLAYRPSWTAFELSAHARSLADRRQVGAVLLDHLQRVPGSHREQSQQENDAAAVVAQLKTLAVELSVPVVASARFDMRPADRASSVPQNRPFPHQEVKRALAARRPTLAALRAAKLEQDADLVLGLMNPLAEYRAQAQPPDESPADVGATNLEVATLKRRDGPASPWTSLWLYERFGLLRDAPAEK